MHAGRQAGSLSFIHPSTYPSIHPSIHLRVLLLYSLTLAGSSNSTPTHVDSGSDLLFEELTLPTYLTVPENPPESRMRLPRAKLTTMIPEAAPDPAPDPDPDPDPADSAPTEVKLLQNENEAKKRL